MLSDKFTAALVYATELHATQTLTGSGVPYIAHLWYYRSLTDAFCQVDSTPLVKELERVVFELEQLVK